MIHFNSLNDVIHNANVLNYADDTVLYLAGKHRQSIQDKLNEDMSFIANWFEENELIINLKKGKTESLLFGTAKRRAKDFTPFKILYRGTAILETTAYKYLGMEIDCTLNLNSHFDKCFKRASARLRLLLPKDYHVKITSLPKFKIYGSNISDHDTTNFYVLWNTNVKVISNATIET